MTTAAFVLPWPSLGAHACLSPRTIEATGDLAIGPRVHQLHLAFDVSLDEEHVRLRVTGAGRSYDLRSRGRHYVLLTLARARLADAAAGHDDPACGWVYADALARGLEISRPQLNLDVHRIRKAFAPMTVIDPRDIVERREDSGQLRIGTAHLSIAVARGLRLAVEEHGHSRYPPETR